MKTKDKTSQYIVNLSRVLSLATADDRVKGKAWYLAARTEAWRIAQATHTPLIRVCAVIAALSPRNKWERNLRDAEAVCRRDLSHRCSTFKANVQKAWAVLDVADSGESTKWDIEQVLRGKKVTAFFNNIYDPSSARVTVDVHMQLAAIGTYLPEDQRPQLTNKVYREIELAITTIAMNNGMMPHEVQATAWLTWKGMNA